MKNKHWIMSKKLILYLFISLFGIHCVHATDYEVVSPNNQLKMKLHVNAGTTYEIWHGSTQLISTSSIGLNLSNGTVIGAGTVKDTQTSSVNNQLDVPIGKNRTLTEAYNELVIEFNENYNLVVRAYDEGLAYRFVTNLGGEITVNSEDAVFNFTSTPKVYFPECDTNTNTEQGDNGVSYSIQEGYRNFERIYNTYISPVAIADNKFSVTPVLFEFTGTPYKIVVTEAGTFDYPGMYMRSNRSGGIRSMRGLWANYPKSVMDPDDYYSNHLVYEREAYIAKTSGSRTFPWRVIIAVDDDKLLLNNQLVYLLAEPSRLTDTSWIRPGKSAWEWWSKAMLEGVSFPVGNKNLSVQLYKYYIDWAAANHLEYMTLDAGYQESWVFELCQYAKQKNVKIILWTWASNVRQAPSDWIKRMKALGASGAKIDFFERNDQVAMQWGYDFAQRLADSKMVGIFHGCPVPTGTNRTYPNILNFEAIRGAEDNFWRNDETPDYHTLFPFIRSLAGPEDYTPGSMRNTTAAAFVPIDQDNTVPMSMGTRTHELSMYIVFDQWLGYLCDSPTEYNKYSDILDFLSKVPTVWDKTVPLDAKLGQYILTAKQKDNDWYVGGMSNWNERTIEVDFSFLSPGVTYQATILRDSTVSSSQPKQYVNQTITVTKDTKLPIYMAAGGGFVIRLHNSSTDEVSNVSVQKQISVYVDEAAAKLQVLTDEKILSAQIYDISGKSLLTKSFNNSDFRSISLSGLRKGIYLVKFQTKQQSSCLRFIY
ncbi:MAG: glycoside hydrolase family 97 catalytic domain-containing protein [Bacteroidota bacterium]|nr:glycoside hydrolase family 97 catalytic domain-containing protein [Bacteroidota bacterium]